MLREILERTPSWVVGIGIAISLGARVAIQRGVSFSTATQLLSVPGSRLPLVFMMTIFFTKYAVGVILARRLPSANEPVFIGSISLCYGFLSGLFLARALFIWRSAERAIKTMSNPALQTDAPEAARR